jgi:ATP-GRASP peptide maturase of grasp-with-spasm system
MILILSTSGIEAASSDIMGWIAHLGGHCMRLNGEDFAPGAPYAVRLSDDAALLSVAGASLPLDGVNVVLYRGRASSSPPSLAGVRDRRLADSMRRHMRRELLELGRGARALLDAAYWIPDPAIVDLNKIAGLRAARAAGLEIPATLVTTSRAAALRFLEEHGKVVVKTLTTAVLETADGPYHLYTELVEPEDLGASEEMVFPCLFQAHVEKHYEIRTFYLEGRCRSMAIFSQLDAKTSVDFRRYNWKRFNRCVPVRLPAEIETRIQDFMERVGLNTGSLDLIKRPDGSYVFLEVNPVGQFGFVSSLCNYRLERELAVFLMAKDAEAGG